MILGSRPASRDIGQLVEQQAEQFLRKRGLKTLERNFRTKAGEIDLIMQDGPSLVFVEVRYRRQQGFGGGADTVTWQKQQRLIRSAQVYLQARGQHDRPCRFDVVAAHGERENIQLHWIKSAFDAF